MTKEFLVPVKAPEVDTNKLDSSPPGSADILLGVSLNMNNQKVYGMSAPTNPDHATTKQYVDAQVAGGGGGLTSGATSAYLRGDKTWQTHNWKRPAWIATTANITLSGAQTIDGIGTTGLVFPVLVKDQTTASQNGLYYPSAGAWTRCEDSTDGPGLTFGTVVPVVFGTANGGKAFMQTSTVGTVGTDAQTWVLVGGVTSIPTGSIQMYAGATAPTGWLLCDGSAIPGGNTALIALVGANTPDLRGRFPVGVGTFATLRASDGLAEASRSPVHSHTVANVSHVGNTTSAGGSNQSRVSTLNGNETGTHNHGGATGNMATTGIPYFGVNFIIKT